MPKSGKKKTSPHVPFEVYGYPKLQYFFTENYFRIKYPQIQLCLEFSLFLLMNEMKDGDCDHGEEHDISGWKEAKAALTFPLLI